jgi:hypothetical protein
MRPTVDLIKADALMRNTQWLNGPTAESFWSALVGEIANLQRDGDKFTIPPMTSPYAWRGAFEIYGRLRDRAETPPDPAIIAEANRTAASEAGWNQYLADRQKILGYARSEQLSEDAAQYIGLQRGDLASPVTTDPEARMRGGGRRPDWEEIADRLSCAIARWEAMPPSERRSIPIIMAARRADAATARLEQRLAALEANSEVTA